MKHAPWPNLIHARCVNSILQIKDLECNLCNDFHSQMTRSRHHAATFLSKCEKCLQMVLFHQHKMNYFVSIIPV